MDPRKSVRLYNRILWFDGISSYTKEQIKNAIFKEKGTIYVEHLYDELKKQNSLHNKEKFIEKKECLPLEIEWNIPEEYDNIDVEKYLCDEFIKRTTKENRKVYKSRFIEELQEYKQRDLYPILKTLIYIIETFRKNNVVWGIGRGSSVSSYILYLIGVHDIDPIEFNLDYKEFLKE